MGFRFYRRKKLLPGITLNPAEPVPRSLSACAVLVLLWVQRVIGQLWDCQAQACFTLSTVHHQISQSHSKRIVTWYCFYHHHAFLDLIAVMTNNPILTLTVFTTNQGRSSRLKTLLRNRRSEICSMAARLQIKD